MLSYVLCEVTRNDAMFHRINTTFIQLNPLFLFFVFSLNLDFMELFFKSVNVNIYFVFLIHVHLIYILEESMQQFDVCNHLRPQINSSN